MDVRQYAFLARQPSARIAARERFWGMSKRGIALLLANAMFWQPLLAQADGIVVSAPGTSLGQAGNGVPIVNIAAPNGSGLSHNQFKDYNVGAQGVILNNVTDRTQGTQLGGIIVGNPNFHGTAASAILNEVNGGNPSQLNGYTEVAGQAAHVIVANPYGVSCNGCGFINSPQVTLTTGLPVLDGNGKLDHYQVDGGAVTLDGAGLNATNIDRFEIVTRSAKLNAELHARQLTIVTGRNDVDAQSLKATPRSPSPADVPALAIDSSALGGMYAGAIKLVGTEAGVGVRLAGNLAASAGDIQLDVNGHLSLAQTAATGAINVKAPSLEVNGPVYAGTSLAITASGDLTARQNLVAKDQINLSSGGQLSNSAIIEAGVNADNSRNSSGDINIAAQNLTNSGSLIASRNLQAAVAQTLFNQGGTVSGQGSTQITAGTLDNQNKGRVLSSGDLNVSAAQLLNAQGGLITSAGNLGVNAGYVNNNGGELSSSAINTLQVASLDNVAGLIASGQNLVLGVTGPLNNQGGRIAAQQHLQLSTGTLDNSQQGSIAGVGITLQTGAFANQQGGRLISTGNLSLTANQVNNSAAGHIASAMALTASVTGLDQHAGGQLFSNSDVSLNLNNGQLNNQSGLITAPGQLLLTNVSTVANQSGEISSAHAFSVSASSLDNSDGKLISDQSLTVRINQALTNVRGLISGTGVDVHAAQLDNSSGTVSSDADLSVQLSAALINQNGGLSSAGNSTVSAMSLSNGSGQLMADQRLSLAISGAVDNQAGTLGAGQALSISAGSLDNRQAGTVVTDGSLDLNVAGLLNNQSGGNVQAKGVMNIQSLNLNNQGGRVSGQNLLTLRSATADNRGGVIRADSDVQLFIDQLNNSQQGVISSNAGIGFIGQRLDNQSGLLSAVGPLQLHAGLVLNNAGRISSQNDLTANIDTLTQQAGQLVAQGNLTLTGTTLDNSVGGLVGATKALNLNLGDVNNQSGEISSQVGVNVTAQRLNNSNGGKLLAGTTLGLSIAHLINQSKGLLFGNTVRLDGSDLDNTGGTLSSQTQLNVNLSGDLNNSNGLLSSDGGLTVNTANLNNSAGSLSSAGALTVASSGALSNQNGSISTDAGLNLSSASLDNRNSGVLSGKGSTHVTTGALDNSHGGRLTSANTLTLKAAQVINQDTGRIASAMALSANVSGLDQQGGELFSNTALSLDLNHGQLNNQGGLINAPGALLLTNLNGVANQNGEISSAQAFTLDAQNLDNSNGKLLSNQALTLRLAQAMSNIKGLISAAALDVHSASLDNTDGLLSSHDSLNLSVDGAFTNHNGTVIADGNLLLNAASTDNSLGQIAGKKDVVANIGNLQQQGGQLIAQGTLSLTGDQLDNRLNGLVGATNGLNIRVGTVDNRGGEISSQGAISLTGQQLDNSDSGQILGQTTLALTVDSIVNRNKGLLSGNSALTLSGTSLDNGSGKVLSLHSIDVGLLGSLDNSLGLFSSEGTLGVRVGALINSAGSLSSAGTLSVTSTGAVNNQGGQLVTDANLIVHSASLDNRQRGTLSGKGPLLIHTGDFDNSHSGRVSSADSLDLTAGQLTNQDGGSIGSNNSLTLSVSGLDQQNGTLFSNTALTLDLNHGQLNNQGGLINAPGPLLLKNLNGVNNQGGEISSAQGFNLTAQALDNSNGKLLSNQLLTLRVNEALTNIKGLIAAAAVDAAAATLDNSGGTLTSRGDLALNVSGLLTNQSNGLINAAQALNIGSGNLNNQGGLLLAGTALTLNAGALDNSNSGLINSQGTLLLTANSLNASNGGEVSAKGNIGLTLGALTQNGGRLLSDAGISLDMTGGDINNQNGLITAQGPLTLSHLRDLNNQSGEISSSHSFNLSGRTLDNTGGKLISSNLLGLNAIGLINQNGLISGWQGLTVTGTDVDNRNNGTLSSRSGNLGLALTGTLLNGNNGALVSQQALAVTAANLDNSGGILSSGSGQTLTVSGLLNNGQHGLIDSGAALILQAMTLGNAAGVINAQQNLGFTGTSLDNSNGSLAANGAVTLDLLGALTNTNGKLASAGPLLVQRASQIDNQGGQLASQSLMTLLTGGLDNSNHGTVAASGQLLLTASGAVLNNADGLIYSQNADVQLHAASLANGKGALQSQGALGLTVAGDIDNQSGRIIAQGGDVTLGANNLDNRGGVLSSLQGAFTAHITGVLKNGYDLNNGSQGGVTQAQRLNLTALGGIDNYGGRISAQTGDALITTGDFDNRNGGLYAKGKINLTGNNFDNSGDNDGQIAGSQIDLSLAGALNNRLGIIESDSTLNITAASIDNQTGKLRALGNTGATRFQIGNLFDNRNGTVESANSDLILAAGSFQNAGGTLLHVGTGTFDLSMPNVSNAGGSIVTRGGLTLNADTWTNSSVIQAGRLTVNVNNFTQTANGQLLASDAFVGTGGNWNNDGLIASSGTLNLNVTGGYSGNGRLSSVGGLGLGAGQVDLGSLGSIAGGSATALNIGGQFTNYGRLTSSADLVLNAGGIGNYGTLGSAQRLTVTTGSLLNDHGLLFSGSDMSLRVSDFNNNYADVYSLGKLSIDRDGAGGFANTIVNSSSSLQSDGDMALAASTIQNIRAVLTTHDAGIYTAKVVEIQCVEGYNAGDCSGKQNHVWELTERDKLEVTAASAASSITAGGNLTLTGGDLLNQSSSIATSGNLTAVLNNVTNSGIESSDTEYTRVFRTERSHDASGWYTAAASITDQYWYESPNYNANNLSGLEPAVSSFIGSTEAELTQFNTTKQLAASDQSYAAIIQAAGAVNITTQNNFDNSVVRAGYNYIGSGPRTNTDAAGSAFSTRVTINQQLPPDLAQQQVNPLSLPGFSLPTGQNGLFRLSGQGGSSAQASQTSTGPQSWTIGGAAVSVAQRDQTTADTQARSLQLGDASQASAASQQVVTDTRNSAGVGANASVVSTTAPVDAGSNGIAVPGHASNSADATTVVGAIPANQSSASTQITPATGQTVVQVQGLASSAGVSQPQKYLIETNPALTDLKQFMSSDYLLAGLGYNPDDSAKRLGDGLYEQTLIQQAIVARTGARFIDGQTSNEAQLKYLMDNAIATKTALNLTVGVSLTSEQVAALTHDIVWMESEVVDGQTVLVPVLYLAQANNRLAPNGALIQGSDVTVIAGNNLTNAGTLKATNSLAAAAGNNLVNSGLVQAGSRLDLLAGNNLSNTAGGVIAGRDVSVTAVRGDVINETAVTTSNTSNGYYTQQRQMADSAARIESANDLSVQAGRDVNNIGGVLQSGRDTTITAGRDVNITSAQVSNSDVHGNDTRSASITQNGSVLTAGRDLSISAGRDVTAIASDIGAKSDLSIAAASNLTLSSAADESHSYGKYSHMTSQADSVTQVGTSLAAGNNLALQAGQNLTLVASDASAGKEAYLYAGANLSLDTAANSTYSYFYKKSSSWNSSKTRTDETSSLTNVGSSVSGGTNTTLIAGNDLLVKASSVSANTGTATLFAGQDLSIIQATDSTFANHQSSSSKSSFGGLKSSSVKDHLGETQTTAVGSLVSGNAVAIAGTRDVTVTGSSVVSTQDLSIQAGRDLTIDAAENAYSRTEMHKEKSTDLTGVLTGNKLGIDDMTGNQHLSISSQSHNGQADQTTLTGSTIGSSGGNVSLSAGGAVKVVASDLVSTKNMSIVGSDVSIVTGTETAKQSSVDKSAFLGVERVMGGSAVDAFNTIRNDAKESSNASDDRLKAVKGAQALLAIHDLDKTASAYNSAENNTPDSSGSLIKIGSALVDSHSKSTSEYDSQTAKQSTVNSGGDLSIVATGKAAGSAGDIHIVGSTLKAADTALIAKNDITLESAQNTSNWDNDSSNNKTSIGASFNIGSQNGFTLDLGAQIAKNMGTGQQVTQVNTTLNTGSLLLESGNNTNLAGAQVNADSIKALIGGDLNITSRQDSETQKNQQTSGGVGASLCIPPFCFGETVTATANIAAGKMNSTYKDVAAQSGLFAGAGGYDITVGKTTTLQGAVIASDAAANLNNLSTDRLITSDLKNVSDIKSQAAGFSYSYGSGYDPKVEGVDPLKAGSNLGGSIPLSLTDDNSSTTHSAVSAGTITVRGAAGANDLVGLDRDTAHANNGLSRPDQDAMDERIDLIQSSADLAKTSIDDYAQSKSDAAKAVSNDPNASQADIAAANAQAASWNTGGSNRLLADVASGFIAAALGGTGAGTAVGIAANTSAADINAKVGNYANQQRLEAAARGDEAAAASWSDGGSSLVLLHGLVGALQGLSSGNVVATAVGTAAAAKVLSDVDDILKTTSLSDDSRKALTVMIAAGVGAASAGLTGGNSIALINSASNSANEELYNRQLHIDEVNNLTKQANDLAAAANITPAQALIDLARGLAYYTDSTWREVNGEAAPDALTLKYLGIALAPDASRYALGSDVPQTEVKVYTPAETEKLLAAYSTTHSDFYDSKVNGQFLIGRDKDSYAVQNFYQQNLNFSQGLGSAVLSGLAGYTAGMGAGVYGTAQGLAGLGNGLVLAPLTTLSNISQSLFQGITNPLDAATQHFDDADAVKLQQFLSNLQGDSYSAAKISGSQDITFALGMIPAGRLGVAGELAAAEKLGAAGVDSASIGGGASELGLVGAKDTSTVLDGVATNIHPGQQGKHIPGNNNFIPGRSSINSDIDPQTLLDGVHNGDYPVVGTGSRGQPIIDFGRPIGVDGASGQSTNFGTIHSGKAGAHIVPTNPTTIGGGL